MPWCPSKIIRINVRRPPSPIMLTHFQIIRLGSIPENAKKKTLQSLSKVVGTPMDISSILFHKKPNATTTQDWIKYAASLFPLRSGVWPRSIHPVVSFSPLFRLPTLSRILHNELSRSKHTKFARRIFFWDHFKAWLPSTDLYFHWTHFIVENIIWESKQKILSFLFFLFF